MHRGHQTRVQSADVERKVDATRTRPNGRHATDGADEQVVPLEAASRGELVCTPDDDELQQDAQNEATNHETHALNPQILEEFGHLSISSRHAMTSISTPTLLGNAATSTVARAGR